MVAAVAGLIVVAVGGSAAANGAKMIRISVSSTEAQANEFRSEPFSVSANGRFVAFTSAAPNLVAGDTNETWDVFIRDRWSGTTSLVSMSSSGDQGDSSSFGQAMSPDGRYVTFASDATDLVPGDTNAAFDAFLRDRWTGTTSRISVSRGGAQANGRSGDPAISADGRYVAFTSDASNLVPGDSNGVGDVFVRDRRLATTTRVSVSTIRGQANGSSSGLAISADGRHIAFTSDASNLVPGDSNGVGDVFVRDRHLAITTRVSVSTSRGQANSSSLGSAISADGRHVAFTSDASNLVPGDTNGVGDVFVRDRQAGITTRVSVSSTGRQGGNASYDPRVSANGRHVAFTSDASNLVPGDTNHIGDVFVRDRRTEMTARVSVSSLDTQGNDYSYGPAINIDGRFVAFSSNASNLVSGDTNGVGDAFLRHLLG